MLKPMSLAGVLVMLMSAGVIGVNGARADDPAAPARMAWGEAANGLKAAVVPIGGEAAKGWQTDFVCPTCPVQFRRNLLGKCTACGATTASTAYKLCESCAGDQRVCQACGVAKPAGQSFVEGEPLRLELHLRNIGERALSVDSSPPRGWRIKVTAKDAAKDQATVWEAREMAGGRGFSQPRTIPKGLGTAWLLQDIGIMQWVERGLMFTTNVGTGVTKAYATDGEKQEVPIQKNLPPGKYTLVAVLAFNPPPSPPGLPSKPVPAAEAPAGSPANTDAIVTWTGRVETAAVEIEIRPK